MRGLRAFLVGLALTLPASAQAASKDPCAVPGFRTVHLQNSALALGRDDRYAVCDAGVGEPNYLRSDGDLVAVDDGAPSRLRGARFDGTAHWLAVRHRVAGASRLVVIDLARERSRVVEDGAAVGTFHVLPNGTVIYAVDEGRRRGVYADSLRKEGRLRLAGRGSYADGLAVAVPGSGRAVAYWVDGKGRPHGRRVVSARGDDDRSPPRAERDEPCLRKGWIVDYAVGTARGVRALKPDGRFRTQDQQYVCDTRLDRLVPIPKDSIPLDYDSAGRFMYVYEASLESDALPARVVYDLRSGKRRVAIVPTNREGSMGSETVTERGTLVFGVPIEEPDGIDTLRQEVRAVTFSGVSRTLFSRPEPTPLDEEEIAYAEGRIYWRLGRTVRAAPAP